MQGRHLRSDAAVPSCQRNSPAPHSRTSLLSLCQGQTPAYAVLSLLPSLSNMGKREELRRDLVSVNCIYVLGRQGKKGNLKLSDTENGTEREGRCLQENESAITAAWQSPRATQRKRKKKNQQLMDYVCLATSYSTEQGAIPKGMWCGNSTVTHFISWTRQTLSGLHTWPHMVLSLLVLIMAKKKPCYSQKWHCTHCFLPSKHASHTPKSSKCSFYYQMLFHLWSITWRILPPLLFSCISHFQLNLGTLKRNAKLWTFYALLLTLPDTGLFYLLRLSEALQKPGVCTISNPALSEFDRNHIQSITLWTQNLCFYLTFRVKTSIV